MRQAEREAKRFVRKTAIASGDIGEFYDHVDSYLARFPKETRMRIERSVALQISDPESRISRVLESLARSTRTDH